MMHLKDHSEEEDNIVIKEESLSNEAWDAAAAVSAACSSSAFSPYRAVTVLTNLQRGNVQTEENVVPQEMTWHTRAAMGEITGDDLLQAAQAGCDAESLAYEDSRGLTALSWAASYGQLPTVRLLVAHGAHVEHEGEDGHTALQLCCSAGHQDVAKVLLSAGAAPDHGDHMGCTPLMFAAAGDHAQCVSELLDHGASFTATNMTGYTAYNIACRRGSAGAQGVLERYLVRLLET